MTLTGACVVAPVSGSPGSPSLQDVMQLYVQQSYMLRATGTPSINAPSSGSPFILPLQGITNVRFFIMRIRNGSLTFMLTSPSPGGTDQLVPGSRLFIFDSPNSNSQLTAIKMFGVADTEYILLGD
jgi:hypothetical protein